MNTTSKKIAKLNESSQERDEFSWNLDEPLLIHQDSVLQEIINAWGGFERLELEARN